MNNESDYTEVNNNNIANNTNNIDVINKQYKNFFFIIRENDYKWMNILFLFFTFTHLIFIQRISYSSILSIIIIIYCSFNIHLFRKLKEIVNDTEQNELKLNLYANILTMWKYYKILFIIVVFDIVQIFLRRGTEIFNMAVAINLYERIFFYLFNFFYLIRIIIMLYTLMSFTTLFEYMSQKSTDCLNFKMSFGK